MTAPAEVAVVGGGAAGLGAAFRLQQAGYRVRLFEANDYVGGRARTVRRGGFTMDVGAAVLTPAYKNVLGIIDALGMRGGLIKAGSTFGLARDDEIHYVRDTSLLRDAFRTPLLSWRSKLSMVKLAYDALRIRPHLDFGDLSEAAAFDTESAAEYALRRLNPEILEYVVDQTVRAVIGTSADQVSKVDFFFSILNWVGATFLVFPDGMTTYTSALARRFDVELQARVLEVLEVNDEVTVTWCGPEGGDRTERFAGCVVATPAMITADLVVGLDVGRAEFLRGITYTTTVNVGVALSRLSAGVPASFMTIPRSVHPDILGITLEHNMAPNRVPPGKGMIGAIAITGWAEQLMLEDDAIIAKKMIEAIERVLPDISNDVEFVDVARWPLYVVRHPAGYTRAQAQFKLACRSNDRLVQLAGDYCGVSSINAATASGESAARQLLESL